MGMLDMMTTSQLRVAYANPKQLLRRIRMFTLLLQSEGESQYLLARLEPIRHAERTDQLKVTRLMQGTIHHRLEREDDMTWEDVKTEIDRLPPEEVTRLARQQDECIDTVRKQKKVQEKEEETRHEPADIDAVTVEDLNSMIMFMENQNFEDIQELLEYLQVLLDFLSLPASDTYRPDLEKASTASLDKPETDSKDKLSASDLDVLQTATIKRLKETIKDGAATLATDMASGISPIVHVMADESTQSSGGSGGRMVSGTPPSADTQVFDGEWQGDDGGGIIDGATLLWNNGTQTTLQLTTPTHLQMQFGGTMYHAELRNGYKIEWTDGRVWYKTQPVAIVEDPGQLPLGASASSLSPRRMHQKENRSMLDSTTKGTAFKEETIQDIEDDEAIEVDFADAAMEDAWDEQFSGDESVGRDGEYSDWSPEVDPQTPHLQPARDVGADDIAKDEKTKSGSHGSQASRESATARRIAALRQQME